MTTFLELICIWLQQMTQCEYSALDRIETTNLCVNNIQEESHVIIDVKYYMIIGQKYWRLTWILESEPGSYKNNTVEDIYSSSC